MGKKNEKGKSLKKKLIIFVLLLMVILFISVYVTSNRSVISYNGNGATSGIMSKNVVYFKNDNIISKNNYTKDGYDFQGWSVYNDKSKEWKCEDGWYTEEEMKTLGMTKSVLSEEEVIEIIKIAKIKNMTLYAQWLKQEKEEIKDDNVIEIEEDKEISFEEEFITEEKPDINKIVNKETVEVRREEIATTTPVINQPVSETVQPPVNSDNNTDKPVEEKPEQPSETEKELTDFEKLKKYFVGKDLYYLLVDPHADKFEFIDNKEIGILGKDISILNRHEFFIYISYKLSDYKIKYHEEDVNNELENREIGIICDEIYAGSIIKEQNDIFKIEQITEQTFRIAGFTENGKNLYKDKTELIIPSKITGNDGTMYSVVEISDFSGYNFKKITIEEGIKKIGNDAFMGNTELKEIILPKSLTTLGQGSFLNTGITKITIPGSIQNIENSAFYGCANLEEVILSEGITSILDSCFSQCTSLKNVTLPISLTTIGSNAFNNCSSLSNIDISKNVNEIGASAFADCTSLTQITIPSNVKSIGEYTFVNCTNLTNVTISEGVVSIGNSAFENCTGLAQITIPGSVKTIGESAFRLCINLQEVTISEGVTNIGSYVFVMCRNLKEITLPSSVTSIGNLVFMSCTNLASITVQKDTIEDISLGNNWNGNCFSQTVDENGYILFYDPSKYQVMSMSLDMDLETEEIEKLTEDEEVITEDEILIEDSEITDEMITEDKTIENEEIIENVENVESDEVITDEEKIETEENIIVDESKTEVLETTENVITEEKEIVVEENKETIQETVTEEKETVVEEKTEDKVVEENIETAEVQSVAQEITTEEIVEQTVVEENITPEVVEQMIVEEKPVESTTE